MVDRFRALVDRPLDPSVARAIVVLASAILLGLTALFVLAAGESGQSASQEVRPTVASRSVPPVPVEGVEGEAPERRPPDRQQDPQDEEGSSAAWRAARALRSHRAIQHVPYREGGVVVALAGARGSRAVLRVSAPSRRAARRGWNRFLGRYGDSGRAYIPVFAVTAGKRSRGGV